MRKLIVIIACLATNNYASPGKIEVSDYVTEFLQSNRKNSDITSSETIRGKIDIFGEETTKAELPSELKPSFRQNGQRTTGGGWSGNSVSEFRVMYPDVMSPEIRKFYRKNMNGSGLTSERIKKEGVADVWVCELPVLESKECYTDNWFIPGELSLDSLKSLGVKYLRKHLRQFSGKLMYVNHEVEYEAIKGKQVVTNYTLRFARVFEGGVVFRNISYVKVILDGRGKLMAVKIKWPVFSEMESLAQSRLRSETEAMREMQSFCERGNHLELLGLTTEQVKVTSVTGAARGWLPLRKDGGMVLTPAYSFSVDIDSGNGTGPSRFVDVPRDSYIGIDDERSLGVTLPAPSRSASILHNQNDYAPVIRTKRTKKK